MRFMGSHQNIYTPERLREITADREREIIIIIIISNAWRSCRVHQGQAFSYDPFPRVSPAIIFNENI